MGNRTVVTKLVMDLSRWLPEGEKAAKSVDKVKDAAEHSAAKNSKAWDAVGKASAVAAGVGVVALGKMVGASMDFDKAMSGVAAVANSSADELRALREAALQAGADTAFSASEAAQAEAELAKAGVSTSDILGGALTGSLGLAAAGQLDLADAATISAQAMNIWKLEGKDVTHIADVLAAGANKSASDVSDLGIAMRQGGLVAAQMGIGMEETVGTLALFSDRALVGSDAGTSLKTMLQRLANPAADAASLMGKLGIRAFDASGEFVGLEAFAGQLQSRLGKLTQEQRNMALSTIFGSDAIRAASILMETGATGVKEYTAAVNDQGAAGRMAATQLDNLAGDMEALSGSIETALIKSGSGANTVLRAMAQGASAAVNAFSGLPGPVQTGTLAVLALTTAGTGAVGVFGSLVPRIRSGRLELAQMGSVGAHADAALGKVGKTLAVGGGVLVGFELLTVGIEKVQDAIIDTVPGVNELTQSLLKARTWDDISKILGDDFEDLGIKIRHLTDPSVQQGIDRIGTGLFGLKPKSLREAQEQVGRLDEALAGLVGSGNGGEAARQFSLIVEAAKAGGATVDQVRGAMPLYRDALAAVANQSTLAADATKKHGAAAGKTAVDLNDERTAAEKLSDSIDGLNSVTATAATTNFDFLDSIDGIKASIKENGTRFGVATQKTRDNERAVIGAVEAAKKHAEAVATQTGSVQRGNQVFASHIATLRRTLEQSGLSRAEVDRLIRTYGRVPRHVPTNVEVEAAKAKVALVELQTRIRNTRGKTVQMNVTATGIDTVQREINRITGKAVAIQVGSVRGSGPRGFSEGGRVTGGVPGRDSVPALLTPGERVLTLAQNREYERRQFVPARALGNTAAGVNVAAGALQVNFTGPVDTTTIGQVQRVVDEAFSRFSRVLTAGARV